MELYGSTRIENDCGNLIQVKIQQHLSRYPKKIYDVKPDDHILISHDDIDYTYNHDRFIHVSILMNGKEMACLMSQVIKTHMLLKLSLKTEGAVKKFHIDYFKSSLVGRIRLVWKMRAFGKKELGGINPTYNNGHQAINVENV